ncbi:MAG: hypothetical protein ACQESC_02820 [Nanobdellota archaeon]
MKIVNATKDHAKGISELMLSDLQHPPDDFPEEMIERFREHALPENILKEFDNPNLRLRIAIENDTVQGFIVGYMETEKAILEYVTGSDITMKKALLEEFMNACKRKGVSRIVTDTFYCMENRTFFEDEGFEYVSKEQVADNLDMLWYEKRV